MLCMDTPFGSVAMVLPESKIILMYTAHDYLSPSSHRDCVCLDSQVWCPGCGLSLESTALLPADLTEKKAVFYAEVVKNMVRNN